MKFEARDVMKPDDADVCYTGECDDDQTIIKIEGTTKVDRSLLMSRGAIFDITTLDGLVRAMPRLQVLLLDEEEEAEEPEDDLEEEVAEGQIVKVDPDRKQVFGWAYVSHDPEGNVVDDRSGEYIEDVEVLEKAAYDFVVKSRKGGVDHGRKSTEDEVVRVSTMIESIVFTPDKIKKMGIPEGTIPQGAWWVGFQIEDPEVWERHKRDELTSFSIHGRGRKVAQ